MLVEVASLLVEPIVNTDGSYNYFDKYQDVPKIPDADTQYMLLLIERFNTGTLLQKDIYYVITDMEEYLDP